MSGQFCVKLRKISKMYGLHATQCCTSSPPYLCLGDIKEPPLFSQIGGLRQIHVDTLNIPHDVLGSLAICQASRSPVPQSTLAELCSGSSLAWFDEAITPSVRPSASLMANVLASLEHSTASGANSAIYQNTHEDTRCAFSGVHAMPWLNAKFLLWHKTLSRYPQRVR